MRADLAALSAEVDQQAVLINGLYDLVASLAERLTGEEVVMLLRKPDGGFFRLEPEARSVHWYPSPRRGAIDGDAPVSSGQRPAGFRQPCVVRRAIFALSHRLAGESESIDSVQALHQQTSPADSR